MNKVNNDNAIEKLQANIKAVQETHENQIKYLTEVRNSLLKLKAEEEKTVQQLATLVGQFNAYQESLKMIQGDKVEKVKA